MTALVRSQPLSFEAMVKPVGSVCNLNCTYCYYLEKSRLYSGDASPRMEPKLLEMFVQQYIAVQDTPVVRFVWQGGEPTLLGIDYFQTIVQLQKKYAGERKVENSLQTNGVLIDDQWARFFKQNGFLVGVSIDGPAKIHDRYRLLKNGQPSFARVLKGVDALRKHKVDFNVLTVVHRVNATAPVEVYRFLKRIGATFIQFIPIVERQYTGSEPSLSFLVTPSVQQATVTPWSVLPQDYGRFLIGVFDDWVTCDVGRVFVQEFDAALANWVGENPGVCVYGETCGGAVVVEHNGDVYSCDHYVYPEYRLGNLVDTPLADLARSTRQLEFGQAKAKDLPPECIKCEHLFACHGECPKHRFELASDGTRRLNYLCEGYKMFYEHITPYMQFMANELAAKRSPANVMAWAKQRVKRR